MFDKKQDSLMQRKASKSKVNAFISAALKDGAKTSSGNGALKYSTTGNIFVDQFGKLGSYKSPRHFEDIAKDCELSWAEDPYTSVVFSMYIRMITRKTMLLDGTVTLESQKGAELKHEGIMRLLWLHFKDEDVFWKNIGLFISAGSWKDIFTMLSYDLQFHNWEGRKLNWKKFGELLLSGLENSNSSDMIKKYLPQIKSSSKASTLNSQADTLIGKWICGLLFGEIPADKSKHGSYYKRYRLLKSSGTAHEWQQLISKKRFDRIDFDKIHGRALSLLVKSKFLFNQDLSDKYNSWITAPETKDVKYTGFVHELFNGFSSRSTKAEKETINKQFDTLVTKGGSTEATKLIVVRDTSNSMNATASGSNMSCYNIGKALALYFSSFLEGSFSDAWIEFNSTAQLHTWKGHTATERWLNDTSSYVGGTNFQSVIRLFADLKAQGLPESEFPTGILCISDSEFNPTSLGRTNVDTALSTLRQAGFSEEYVQNFVIVLWNLSSNYYGKTTGQKFETYGDVPNVFYFSGYSAATISFLTSKIKNARELFEAAMDQELLRRVNI